MVEGKTEIFSRKKFLEKKGIFINMPFKIGFVGRWVSVVFMFKNRVWSSHFQYGQKEGTGRNGTNFLRSDNTLSVLVFSWAVAELKIQVYSFRAKRQIFLIKQEQPFTIVHNCTLYLQQPGYDYSYTGKQISRWDLTVVLCPMTVDILAEIKIIIFRLILQNNTLLTFVTVSYL